MGPYDKDIRFHDFNVAAYATVEERGPHMNWETANPDWWVPQGYAMVRVDQRGTGGSAGRMALQDPQEYDDLHDVVGWAAAQPWNTGRVALMGISYYAMNQCHFAAMRPPGLAAIAPGEGAVDLYREWSHHGDILRDGFTDAWWVRQITGNQHGLGDADRATVLPGNADLPAELRGHPLLDEFFRARQADLAAIEVPLLSAGNWGGFPLHLRGNVAGYCAVGNAHKWLGCTPATTSRRSTPRSRGSTRSGSSITGSPAPTTAGLTSCRCGCSSARRPGGGGATSRNGRPRAPRGRRCTSTPVTGR